MIKRIIPGKDRILFELDQSDEEVISSFTKDDGTEGVLYSPEKKRMPNRKATVIAVGAPLREEDKDAYKPGDRIIVSWYTGRIINDFDLKWNDERHKICRYDEVLAKIEEV
jgi:co-chaperonin GroES (HSP10)